MPRARGARPAATTIRRGSRGRRGRSRGVALVVSAAPLPTGGEALELRLHERVQVAIEHGGRVAGLVGSPKILDHLGGVQNIAPDLVAPARLDVLTLERSKLGLLLLEGALEQAGLQDLGRVLLVLGLRPLVLALDDDAGGQAGQAHRGVGLVDVLAARALRAVGVDPDLVPVELDLDVIVDFGKDLDEREGRLAPLLRVERADAVEAMDAALGAQPAIG